MKILIVEADPAEILRACRQFSDHEVKVIKNSVEFLTQVSHGKFIFSFDAILLSNMFLSKSGRTVAITGMIIAYRAIKQGVAYVGMFTYTDRIISTWAKKHQTKKEQGGRLVVAKIRQTLVGSMLTKSKEVEKDWAGLLSGLIAANAN